MAARSLAVTGTGQLRGRRLRGTIARSSSFGNQFRLKLSGRGSDALYGPETNAATNRISMKNIFNIRRGAKGPALYVDMTTIAKFNVKTGIQRVAHNILKNLISIGSEEFEICPVYRNKKSYRTICFPRFDGEFDFSFKKTRELIRFKPHDRLFLLDLDLEFGKGETNSAIVAANEGMRIYTLMHDLLPITNPEWFLDYVSKNQLIWLNRITDCSHTVICVSKTVSTEYKNWITENIEKEKSPRIEHIYNGTDFSISRQVGIMANELIGEPFFLVVGTLEPRKGHAQVLAAMQQRWKSGDLSKLVFVGKQGWKVNSLVTAIRQDPLYNKNLFWFPWVSDPVLRALYANCRAVIVASQAEGFGLPLIEAGAMGAPVIARDIPVFREVAGKSAYFFSGFDANSLSVALEEWENRKRTGKKQLVTENNIRAWDEVTKEYMDILTKK